MTTLFTDSFAGPSLNPAWSKRGTFTESFDGSGADIAGMDGGEGLYMTLASLGLSSSDNFTVDVEFTKSAAGSMVGPMVTDDSGAGFCLSYYSSPAGLLFLSSSAYTYGGSFSTIVSEAAQATARYRVRRSGSSWYCSRSLDGGSSWSPEVSAAWAGTPTRIGLGNIFQATVTNLSNLSLFEVATAGVTPPAALAGIVPATSAVSGSLLAQRALAGTVAATSAVAGDLTSSVVEEGLAGVVELVSGVDMDPDEDFDGGTYTPPALPDLSTLIPRRVFASSLPPR